MSQPAPEPWKRTKEELVYNGYRKMLRRTFVMPDGQEHDFDVVKSGGSVAILAVTKKLEVVCFEQFRPGPEQVLCELPGGGAEDGEEFIDAVRRELLEETGYEADAEFIGSYWRDAYFTGQWHMFVGRNAVQVAEPHLDPTEFGRPRLLPLEEFKQRLFAGRLTDTTLGYAGLRHLGLL